MKGINAFQISKAFKTNKAFVYGVPKTVMTDNGLQFCAKFLEKMHRVLGVKLQITKTYNPKENFQTEILPARFWTPYANSSPITSSTGTCTPTR